MNDAPPDESLRGQQGLAVRWLRNSLMIFGIIDLLALAGVLLPYKAMNSIHRSSGLGELPNAPIVGYLARTGSLMYAIYGGVLLFVATDVRRYGPLIRFLALLAIGQGAILVAIDSIEAMPFWWRIIEGACLAAMGAWLLLLKRAADRSA